MLLQSEDTSPLQPEPANATNCQRSCKGQLWFLWDKHQSNFDSEPAVKNGSMGKPLLEMTWMTTCLHGVTKSQSPKHSKTFICLLRKALLTNVNAILHVQSLTINIKNSCYWEQVKGDAYPGSILKLQNCKCQIVLRHSQVLPLLIFLIRLNV